MTHEESELESENARLRHLLAQAGMDAAESDVVQKLQKALIGELHHRVKNMLAMVVAITSQSIRGARSLEAAQDAVHSRISALARSYDALQGEDAEGASLERLLKNAVQPYDQGGRFKIAVPEMAVAGQAALPLSLVFNELCTNAAKYGALTSDGGRVDITAALNQQGDRLAMVWTERAGPPVTPPASRSFGTRMIEVTIPDAPVRLNFLEGGLVCELDIPLSSLI